MPTSPLISAAELFAQIGQPDLRIFDCRVDLLKPEWGREAYLLEHIPGAIFADLNQDLAAPPTPLSGRHPLPEPKRFISQVAKWGIEPGVKVVVYDSTGGGFASRLWWMLRSIGHNDVKLLDGGLPKWKQGLYPLRPGEVKPHPTTYTYPPFFNPHDLFITSQVLKIHSAPNWRLIDARARERYLGQTEPIDPIAGHIPGAVNRFHGTDLTPDGVFKPAEQLRLEFEELLAGIPAEKTVVYCGSGVTSCHLLLAMQLAGLPGARLYVGSWSEWIRDTSRPIALG